MFHSVHIIAAKLVSNWEQIMLSTKSEQVLNRKRISMLTDLKVSSLTCKCVFTNQNLMQKGDPWNWILKVLKYRNEVYQRIELM